MIYDLNQLHSIILPMAKTACENNQPESLTAAIIELICQDRVNHIAEKGTSDQTKWHQYHARR